MRPPPLRQFALGRGQNSCLQVASRSYRLVQRQASIDASRARVVAAARARIIGDEGIEGFTLDAVAREAGVTRTTIYNQFQSRRGLLEAVCDDLAFKGGIRGIDEIIADPDPLSSLHRYVEAFVKLYSSDRILFRRLFAMAALDAEFGAVLSHRSDRRRKGLRYILRRIHGERYGGRISRTLIEDQALTLKALLNFDVFDTLVEGGQGLTKVTRNLQQLAIAAVIPARTTPVTGQSGDSLR